MKMENLTEWKTTNEIPFVHNKSSLKYNANNVNKVSDKYGVTNLEEFFK